MPITRNFLLITCAAFLLFSGGNAFSQTDDLCNGQYPCNPRARTFAQELQSRGIGLSQNALLAALHNSDSQVRWLAAFQLAENHDRQALPDIENALQSEVNLKARINIASALVSLGDPAGAQELERACGDASLPISVTTQAANSLYMAHVSHPELASPSKCAPVVLGALENPDKRDWWSSLLSLLPSIYPDAPPDQASRIVVDTQKLLGDKDPSTRMAASRILARIGSTASIPLLRSTISREQDTVVRTSLQRDLAELQKRSR